MTQELETLGFYDPGFIHLRINTHEELNNLDRLKNEPSTIRYYSNFFHEYIHFLQDITSSHGILNFLLVIQYIRNSNAKIRTENTQQFEIPLRLDNDANLLTNSRVSGIYYGDRCIAEDVTYQSYTVIEEKVESNIGEKIAVSKYIINYYDNRAQTKMNFHFGSRCIKEYMAHALQQQLFPETDHDDIPYKIVEQIVSKEYPSFGTDPLFIVALCDASLMGFHPADLFFTAIMRMKEISWIPSNIDEIYQFCHSDLTFQSLDGSTTETVMSLYDKQVQTAKQYFHDALQSPIYANNVIWFNEILDEAKALRANSQSFFTKLVSAPEVLSPFFISLLRRLGTPFMTNIKSHGYFMPPEKLRHLQIHPYFPKLFQSIIRTYQGERSCNMYDFCGSRPDMQVADDRCLTEPWTRINATELCPYAQLWKTWGLSDYKPI